ncbi:MAG TPA: hypothetical protein VGC41_27240, partial [Kofleriaceae bacterium]
MRFAIAVLMVSAACGTDAAKDPPPDAAPAVTWYRDVAPIVSTHCMGCHQAGGIAPFSLTAYEDAADNGKRMLDQIDKGAMPPFD